MSKYTRLVIGYRTESIALKNYILLFKKSQEIIYIIDNGSIFTVDVYYKPEIYKGW